MFATLIALSILTLHPSPKPTPFSSKEKAQIEKFVKDELADPQSAQFQWYIPVDEMIYCGRVNAKNKLGGYVGFTPYQILYVRDRGQIAVTTTTLIMDPEIIEHQVSFKICLEAGYPIQSAP
jgi:hypothetical protein